MSMAVFRDHLCVLANGREVFRYEGRKTWRSLGTPHRSMQNYGVAVHRSKLHVGTWPECEVFAHEDVKNWQRLGRVGYEREVMALSLYNGKIYLGTLPMANGWRMDDDKFTFIGNADGDPAYRLRRLWSMAVHQGRPFAGTAPSGHLVSFEAGKSVTSDRALPGGWHHLAAVP